MSDERRLGITELEARTGFHRNTIGKWVRSGKFPRPHYLADRRRWWLHEVEAWEREHAAEVPRRMNLER